MDDAYGAAFARIAERDATLSKMGGLSIMLSISHPISSDTRQPGRGNYNKGLDAYLIQQPLDYADWITPDWTRRTIGYARSVKTAISRVAKTRLTESERAALLQIADHATSEIVSAPPETVVLLRPVHLVYYPGNPTPGVSFGGIEGLAAFHPAGVTYVEVPPDDAFKVAQSLISGEPVLPELQRIYRREGDTFNFYEAFPRDDQIVEHWGTAGQGGDNRFHPFATPQEAAAIIAGFKIQKWAEGFRPIPQSKQARLIIEYPISENFADGNELDFRYEAENYLDDLLGRMGLGHCDGGSSGQGTTEICNFVIDFKLTEVVLKRELAGTAFKNYSRIYLER